MSEENIFDTCSGISDYVHGLIFDSIFATRKEQTMSREKQIIEIKECIDSVYGADCAYFDVDGFAIANKIYDTGYRKQEWTSVKERLPEESDWYLVNIISPFDFEFVSISHYSKGYGWNNPDTVTHWMPLPEAPKMKGGAE